MGERFIDAVHLAALTGDRVPDRVPDEPDELPAADAVAVARPRKACCIPSAFGRLSEARVIRVRS
jgi:hypothetical protein